jgi:hypothetical protein
VKDEPEGWGHRGQPRFQHLGLWKGSVMRSSGRSKRVTRGLLAVMRLLGDFGEVVGVADYSVVVGGFGGYWVAGYRGFRGRSETLRPVYFVFATFEVAGGTRSLTGSLGSEQVFGEVLRVFGVGFSQVVGVVG